MTRPFFLCTIFCGTLLHLQTSSPLTVALIWLQHAYSRLFPQAILSRKVRHTDLAFGVWSGFTSRFVYARLQVSVSCGYDLYHPG